ncbi:8205_t:CDS:2 [Gigaspora margarita]|uniref:8205_t:CDS:1 n=1 Tax=Gigaspora margarita TaxID=4874 RepID=A0ABN7VNH0_GIGMA|nr:8205_t:CDS:2 [Gigaspora margarita]
MSSSKRKNKTTLNNKQRKDIIDFKNKNPNISNIDLAEWVKKEFSLEVHPATIGCLIKNKNDIGDNLSTKRQRTVQYPDFENTLFEWILQNQNQIIISDTILIEKAKKFAKLLNIPDSDLKFSHGWLYKFKRRHELGQIKKHGEDASVDDNVVANTIPKLREFNKKMAGRKVILLVDNAKCHSSSNLNLYNTTIHYLPPNTTFHIQPMDADIILSFKCRYRSYFIKWLLDQYESGKDEKLNVLNAIKFIVRAWREVSSKTISNCFRHTRIFPTDKELVLNDNDDNNNDELMEEMYANIEALNFRNVMDLEEFINHPEEKETNEVLNDEEILAIVTNIESEKTEDEENGSDKEEDDSTEMRQITYHEALSAIEVLEQYLMQQDVGEATQSNHDQALSNLQEEIRKL